MLFLISRPRKSLRHKPTLATSEPSNLIWLKDTPLLLSCNPLSARVLEGKLEVPNQGTEWSLPRTLSLIDLWICYSTVRWRKTTSRTRSQSMCSYSRPTTIKLSEMSRTLSRGRKWRPRNPATRKFKRHPLKVTLRTCLLSASRRPGNLSWNVD